MTSRDDFLDTKQKIEVLLVEDSPSDAMLTIEALREGCVTERLHHVEDGVEALAYLRREGKYCDVRRPDVVLLDLNMPRKNGHEVLKEIRADDALQFLPVIVLTTSDDERDVLDAYGENANCYITKPVDLNAFVRAMRSLGDFWLKWVTLPPRTV
ncbi:response regulator [Stieleria sp. ICT_E10.1]|uniref:response regulator n=1 Tax=Stieleria sedimenti TaxID=2976331 RepID=UPI00217F46D1|nr:response regulator [Stieleria sedimenti]MCS7466499.1 response regulator [Stieleria sedimenti]